jgi:hypothetical protein
VTGVAGGGVAVLVRGDEVQPAVSTNKVNKKPNRRCGMNLSFSRNKVAILAGLGWEITVVGASLTVVWKRPNFIGKTRILSQQHHK